MIFTTGGHVAPRVIAMLLPVLWSLWFLPCTVAADEMSEVPSVLPPAFSLPDIAGQSHNLDEFAGKVLLVNFWASWCTPCIQELPGIRRLADAMRDQPFAVIGINVGEAERRVSATARRQEMNFTVLLDRDSAVFRSWSATVLPTTYVLDRNGLVRYIGRGPLEWDRADVVETLKQLAEQGKAVPLTVKSN
jgi:peroxiredoxin